MAANSAGKHPRHGRQIADVPQMEAYGGPAQPSPTIAQCLNGGYGWLQVKCLHVSSALVHREPAALDRQFKTGGVFGRRPF
jgi:hypothetical protein